jgi:hypothetical protein
MSGIVGQLERQAEHCLHLAYQCQDQKVRRVLRLLAADLTLAAERQRKNLKNSMAAELAELTRLSRQVSAAINQSRVVRGPTRPESASTA